MSDYHIIGPREDGYIVYEEGLFMGLMDNERNVVISTERHYRSIYNFSNGVAIVYYYDRKPDEGGWGLVDEQGNEVCECKYWYIELLAGSLYRVQVTPGGKKNLMWNDGKLIFKESYGSLYGYRHGYIIASNTIRKTKTTPTRYLKGLLHVRGDVLLPVEYDQIEWVKDRDDMLYTARKGYIGYVKALYGEHVGIELDVELPNMWFGVKGTVCEGCIYTRGIDYEGKGCGRLFTKSFRDRNLRSRCEYRKTKLNEPSQFERQVIERWKLILRLEDPYKEPRQLVKDFIEEKLDGDINGLVNYDFGQLKDMERYGNTRGYSFTIYKTDLVRAIATVIFDDLAPKEVMFDKKWGTLVQDPSPIIPEILWGSQVGDWFYMPAFFHCKEPKALAQRIIPCASLCRTIGNLSWGPVTLFRSKIKSDIEPITIINSFAELHNTLAKGQEGQASGSNKKKKVTFFDPYYGKAGWDLLVRRLMVDSVLVDYYGNPNPFFDATPNYQLSAQNAYLKVLDQCINLCHELIPARSKRMVQRLKEKLYTNG